MASGSKKKMKRSGKKPSLNSCLEYYKKVEESEGFDCDDYPKFRYGFVRPSPDDHVARSYNARYADLAIKHYNQENNTEYELVEVLKTNRQSGCGIIYFITFNAKKKDAADDDTNTKTFQAKVIACVEVKVIFVRLKFPQPSTENGTNEHEYRYQCNEHEEVATPPLPLG